MNDIVRYDDVRNAVAGALDIVREACGSVSTDMEIAEEMSTPNAAQSLLYLTALQRMRDDLTRAYELADALNVLSKKGMMPYGDIADI